MALKRSDIKHCPMCTGKVTINEDLIEDIAVNATNLVLRDSILRTFKCNKCNYMGYWEPDASRFKDEHNTETVYNL